MSRKHKKRVQPQQRSDVPASHAGINPESQTTSAPTRVDAAEEVQDDAIIGQALRWSLLVLLVVASVAAGMVWWFSRPAAPTPIRETELAEVQRRKTATLEPPRVMFTDITQSAGIQFRHENGARGKKLLPETMGGGCAFLDYDNDGHQDLLLINSNRWPWDAAAEGEPDNHYLALYQNDGHGNFVDVTEQAGLKVPMYGMGVAVGDYDNDGFVDIFVANLGKNRLFRNRGDGTFEDMTDEAGLGGDPDEWSCSCGWFDYNNDGQLDLFVGNYLTWTREFDEVQNFQLTGGDRAYGRPQNFEGTFPYLYRNDGNGRFTEVAESAGLCMRNPATNVPMAKTLGVKFIDIDRDGHIDIFVANDTVQNFLFHNQGDGTFREVGATAGVAYDMNGNARGAMGIDAGYFRDNESIGIVIGNFANEMTALYVSRWDRMQFMDEAISSGLGPNTRLELTFGVFLFDYDLDGRLDFFAANGHLEEDINRVQPSQHYEQPPQLFWNCGADQDTEFMPVGSEWVGPSLLRPMVGRGAAYADIDGDGDLDLIIMGVGQPPRLLRNDQQLGHHWLRIKLEGVHCNRDAIGAWVEVETAEGTQRRQVMPTRSYLSQVELPVTFGLGNHREVRRVTIYWPDGTQQQHDSLEADRLHVLRQKVESGR